MKNPTITGIFKLKISAVGLQKRQELGIEETAIIHERLEYLLAGLDPITRKRLTFEDCKIIEGKESALPF